MNSEKVQEIVVAWKKCCEATSTKLDTVYENYDEWLSAIEECCEEVNENSDEIIELLTVWAAEWEATYTDYQCGVVDNELTTTTTTTLATTTTIPATTTTTTVDPDQIDWEVVFENYLCQQEDDPNVTSTTTIPLKSGTIDFDATYTDYLCGKEDNPLITTTTTTISGTTTTTTTVDPEDVTFTATYTNYTCEKVNNPLKTTTTTTTTINEDDILWEVVFENYLCQQTDVTTTTTTSTTLPVTTTTTTTSELCGIEISGGVEFPGTYNINLGTGTGTVVLDIEALEAPDKFIVEWNGIEVIDTGYRGDTAFQNELYAALAAQGAPAESIVEGGSASFSFNKDTSDPIAVVKVYAPIGETKWSFTLNCPGAVTTTTVNPLEVNYEATYEDYLCELVDNPNITTTTTTEVPTTTTTTAPVTTTTTTIGEYEINCGQTASGGDAYPMEVYITDLGAGTGYVNLNYDAGEVPDKFIVEIDGLEVINTGYRGHSDLQSILDDALTEKGEPLETIQGIGLGTATFFKSSATTIAIVKVFAPIDETEWEFVLTCPDGGTTTTTTTAVQTTTTTTTTVTPTTTTTTTNAVPVSQNNTIDSGRSIGNCSVNVILVPSDFPFTDADGDELGFVKINTYSLLGNGELTYKNKVVNDGDILRVFGGVAGSFQHTLEYTPDGLINAEYSDTINFSVATDNNLTYSNISTLTMDNAVCGATTTTTTTIVPATTTTTTALPVTTTTTSITCLPYTEDSTEPINASAVDFNYQPIDGTREYAMLPRVAISPTTDVMVLVYRLGYDHVGNNDNGIVIQKSTDKGLTWSAFSYIVEDPTEDDRNPVVFYTPTGRLVMIYLVMESGIWYDSVLMYSDDDGVTWSAPSTLVHGVPDVLPITAPYSNRCFIDNDEYLYFPWHTYDSLSANGALVSLARSTDDGETWDLTYKTIFDGLSENKLMAEAVAVDLGGCNWAVICRCDSTNPDGKITPVIMISNDNGQTWGANGADTLLFSEIGDDINSDFLYLNGEGVTLAKTTATGDSCLPDGCVVDIDGDQYLNFIYWIRDNTTIVADLRYNLVPLTDVLTTGVRANIEDINVSIYDSVLDYGNGGNDSSIVMDNEVYIVNAEQMTSNSGGGEERLNHLILRSAFLDNMKSIYLNPVTTTTTTAGVGLKNNLISVWELDETSGATGFDAHGSNDLVNNGFTINQTGKLDKAYLGNGGSTSLINGDVLDVIPAAFSISTWFKTPAVVAPAVVVAKQTVSNSDRLILGLADNSGFRLKMDYEINDGGYQFGTPGATIISADTWYHVVLIWSTTTGVSVYLDNSLDSSNPALTTLISSGSGANSNFNIGSVTSGSTIVGYDLLDDQTAVWERELTTGEISQLYNSGNGLAYTSW